MWIDTETTGLEPTDSAAFEVALILVDGGKVICERCFFLNPLSDKIKYHEEAGKVHGYSEKDIRTFPLESEQVPKIACFLEEARELFKNDGSKSEKMTVAGYNVQFDIKHLAALLERNGYKWGDYFSGIVADVYGQVKAAGTQKALPYLPNRRLETIAEHLGVNLDNAHDALADIRATREVAAKLYKLGVNLL
jgi:DNA polymerase III epsilon subunit-like protein